MLSQTLVFREPVIAEHGKLLFEENNYRKAFSPGFSMLLCCEDLVESFVSPKRSVLQTFTVELGKQWKQLGVALFRTHLFWSITGSITETRRRTFAIFGMANSILI